MLIRMTCLHMYKSHLYQNGVVLRHEDTGEVVATPKNFAAAKAYCKRRGFDWKKMYKR